MSCTKLYVDNDNNVRLDGLINPANGEFVNDAVVELTLLDAAGDEVAGQAWPLTLSYIAASDGNYEGVVESTVVAEEGDTGTMQITATRGALIAEFELEYEFAERDDTTLYLTSKREMQDMFGVTNVNTWADLENEGDAADISRRINWAVREATEEARTLLLGSVALDGGCYNDSMLRMAVTRLAGVLLYESRGVKDTADEEGRHRLKWHRDRARLYFQQVQAGQLRIRGENAENVPAAVKNVPTTDYNAYDMGLGVPNSA